MIDYAKQLLDNGAPIACNYLTGINDNMVASHYHDFYELYYLESGERFHFFNDSTQLLAPGQFVLFEPYTFHHSFGKENMPFSRYLLYFRKEAIDAPEILNKLESFTGIYKASSAMHHQIISLLAKLLEEQEHADAYSIPSQKSLLNLILISILRETKKVNSNVLNSKIAEVVSYINAHYKEKISVEALSKKFYMSKWHLCREFKQNTDTTIIQYINYLRIMEAQKLIAGTNQSITEICLCVGFDTIAHFERTFKAIVGCTPSKFRKPL